MCLASITKLLTLYLVFRRKGFDALPRTPSSPVPPPPSSPSVEQLLNERRVLLGSSRAQNTMRTYALAWSTFHIFRGDYQFDTLQAPDIEHVALFISYMSWHKFAATTIASYVSGLSFYLRSNGKEDVTQLFPIRRLIDGCRRRHSREDVRCPIT